MTRSMQDFLDAAGWSEASVAPLAGEASSRSYHRLTADSGCTAVLMDAGPGREAETQAFLRIGAWLRAQGLSAPEVLAQDVDAGLLLLEDLGAAPEPETVGLADRLRQGPGG